MRGLRKQINPALPCGALENIKYRGGDSCFSDGGGKTGDLGHFFDIMDPEDMGAGKDGGGEGGGGAEDALGGVFEMEDFTDEAFAAGADEYGDIEVAEIGKMFKQEQVVLNSLAETYTGVDDNLGAVDTGGKGEIDAFGEKLFNFADDVGIGGIRLHRPGVAKHVHEDNGSAGPGGEVGHFGIETEGGDVVDEVGAGLEGGGGDGGTGGIDADGDVKPAGEGPDDGADAPDLFIGGDGKGTWAGGFAADVDDVGAVVGHKVSMGHSGGRVEKGSAIAKGVGGDVEDAHNHRFFREPEDFATTVDAKIFHDVLGHTKENLWKLEGKRTK